MSRLPIAPVRLPLDLVGQPNGEVDAGLLEPIGFGGFLMHHKAARAMRAMRWAVWSELGIILWATSTLRSYARQLAAFDGTDERWWDDPHTGRYVPERLWARYEATGRKWAKGPDIRTWGGQRWKRRAGTAASARPGTSNHGMAIAIDLAILRHKASKVWSWARYAWHRLTGGAKAQDGPESMVASVPEGFEVVGVPTALVNWLIAHSIRFGYSFEDQDEVWHLRYVAGDEVPAAVLAFEASNAPSPEEDDVHTLAVPERRYDSRTTKKPFAKGETRVIPLGLDVKAAFVNVTVVDAQGQGFLTLYGAGPRPAVSNVNFQAGDTIANSAWVPLSNGALTVYAHAACHVVIDLQATQR